MHGKLQGGVDCGACLENNKESSRQKWKRKDMCEGLEVCTGEWQAVLCSWSSENERGVVGDEVELVGGGSSCTASCESQGTCYKNIFQGSLHICPYSIHAEGFGLYP